MSTSAAASAAAGGRRRAQSSPGPAQSRDRRSPAQLKDKYRIVVMGAARVGKTCLVSRLLYRDFISHYKATVEEFHRGEYEINGRPLTLDILDTAGSYEFPAMRDLSIATGDAFILVYSLDEEQSFERVRELRQQILDAKQAASKSDDEDSADVVVDTPIVIVGNKADLEQETLTKTQRATMETTVAIDWGHGYVEASAKDNVNVAAVFKELLTQAKLAMGEDPVVKRRGSLPGDTKGHSKEKTKLGKRNSANCTIS